MTSFRDIPIEDVNYLLENYHQDVRGNKYLTAWNLLLQNSNILVPKSIADWINNYNNLQMIDHFNNLPEELIAKLLRELDIDSLTYFCSSNIKNRTLCDKYVKDMMLEKLSLITKLDLTNYSFIDLLRIYKSGLLEDNKVILFEDKSYMIVNNNLKVYSNVKENLPKILKNGKICSKIVHRAGKSIYILDIYGNVSFLTKIGDTYHLSNIETKYKFKDICHEEDHMLALDYDGYVYGKGINASSQLGYPQIDVYFEDFVEIPDLENIIQISCGRLHSLALDKNGNVFSFGKGTRGELGYRSQYQEPPKQIPNLNDIIKVSAGYMHSLYLDKFGNVYGSGDNEHRQVGVPGNYGIIFEPTLIKDINNVVDIYAAKYGSYFLTKEGIVYTCGYLLSTMVDSNKRKYNYYDKPTKILNSENTIKMIFKEQELALIKNDVNIYLYVKSQTYQRFIIEL